MPDEGPGRRSARGPPSGRALWSSTAGSPTLRPDVPPRPTPRLRRSIRLGGLVLYGLGTTIGAGIYALLGVVAGRAGMAAPLAFAVASLLAAFTALSFAELCARFPRAGGEAVYVYEGFRRRTLFVAVGLAVAAAGTVSAATVTVAFAGYLDSMVAVPRALAVLAVVVVLGGVAAWGIAETVLAASLLTLVEIGGLLLVTGAGLGSLAALPERAGEILLPGGPAGWTAVASAGVVAFYAFLGFEDMVNVAEEVHEVKRTLPMGILLTLLITTLLYVVLATVAVLTVPPEALGASDAPLAQVYEVSGGRPEILAGIALLAMLNGALIQVVKASRVVYGLADQGGLPRRLARVHPGRRTPLLATALATLGAGLLALFVPLEALATLTSLITLTTFALADLALVVVKRRDPHPPGVRTWPIWIPATGCAASVAFAGFEVLRRIA